MKSRQRLCAETLTGLPQAIQRPRFDRTRLRPGIVHLGLGAFARAFLACATDDAIESAQSANDPLDDPHAWGIVGVSFKHRDTVNVLTPQDGLSTVAFGDRSGVRLRVIGSVIEVRFAPDEWRAIVERIAARDTRVISLTITEKAYVERGPHSPMQLLAQGLAARYAAGTGPVSLMSLDNLPTNGATLRNNLIATFSPSQGDVERWVGEQCRFPNTMVDRIVPRTTDEDRVAISAALELIDRWPIAAEPYMEWAIEDQFASGCPNWAAGGAQFVDDVGPWEQRKLRMVNGAHSCIAYMGLLAGWTTVDQAIDHPLLRDYIEVMLRDEVAPTLAGVDVTDYTQRLISRFFNPRLKHACAQIAMDGSHKIPLRLLATIRDGIAQGSPIERLCLGVGAWLTWLPNVQDTDDPNAVHLRATAATAKKLLSPHDRVRMLVGAIGGFEQLIKEPKFINTIARSLTLIDVHGIAGALARYRR